MSPVPQRSNMELESNSWGLAARQGGRGLGKEADHGEWRSSPGPSPILLRRQTAGVGLLQEG